MATLQSLRESKVSQLNAILAPYKRSGGSNARLNRRDANQADRLVAEIETIDRVEKAELDNDRQLSERSPARTGGVPAARGYDHQYRIGQEKRTYRPDEDPTGQQFLSDVTRSFLNQDPVANERLTQHSIEERVDRGAQVQRANVGTSNFSGVVVPQYLTDLYAPAVATMRPLADRMNAHNLPESGMTLNISRITSTTAVGIQTEGNAVATADIDDTPLVIPVQTAAGYADLTRQAIERGTGVDEITMDDLLSRHASVLDSTILTQATTGFGPSAQVTTYTSASPTAPELWPFIFQSQSKLEAALLGRAMPDYVVMHSRRWNWLCSLVGTSFPFIGNASVPTQNGGLQLTNSEGPGVRGILSNGLKVIVDNNIPTNISTNQDEIYVFSSREAHLWEDEPVFIRAEQPLVHQLAVRVVVYSYFGYTVGRYVNNPGVIRGTGLAAPAGF
jgi:hypothetical protein